MRTVAVAIALAVIAVGCFASRRSPAYECERQSDCADGRTCTDGFCILDDGGCPAACDSCDTRAMTCAINCDGPNDCDVGIRCPADYDCTIHCTAANACSTIDCTGARGCTISCDDTNACTGAITCGDGSCDVRCNARNACPTIDCTDSCACDVACDQADSDCGVLGCPRQNGNACTSDGTVGANCSSTVVPACSGCP